MFCGLFAPPYHRLVPTAVAGTGDTVVKLHVHPVYLLHHEPGLSPAKSRNCFPGGGYREDPAQVKLYETELESLLEDRGGEG